MYSTSLLGEKEEETLGIKNISISWLAKILA